MRTLLWLVAGAGLTMCSWGDGFKISNWTSDGSVTVANCFSNGVVTVEKAAQVGGPRIPHKQVFSTNGAARLQVSVSGESAFYRALAVDLAETASPLFKEADIVDLPSFADKIASPSSADAVSTYLSYRISGNTMDSLFYYAGGADPALAQSLATDLSQVILGGPLYDAELFANVTLSARTRELLGLNPQGDELARLNRFLLEDAYPLELAALRDPGFTNLVLSFGTLSTVAGAGGTSISPSNKWLLEFEGGPATNALLSRPHIAMADRAGNIYIADKEAHAIRKVTTDGMIHTAAGNNEAGYGSTAPVPATSVSLNNPNGLWVKDDGTFFILDTDNGLIRKVDTNGIMTLLVDHRKPIPGGRGLWVNSEETLVYFSASTAVKKWDTTNGLTTIAGDFVQLGNIAVDPKGGLAVTDRGANSVYRVAADGAKTLIAGTGSSFGSADGLLATNAALWQVRGIWFLPGGGYFLATDNGSQVWYVDTRDRIHLFLNGDWVAHAGDGAWFYEPLAHKVSKVRQITMDFDGNLIVTENDSGYIRKVEFMRHVP